MLQLHTCLHVSKGAILFYVPVAWLIVFHLPETPHCLFLPNQSLHSLASSYCQVDKHLLNTKYVLGHAEQADGDSVPAGWILIAEL